MSNSNLRLVGWSFIALSAIILIAGVMHSSIGIMLMVWPALAAGSESIIWSLPDTVISRSDGIVRLMVLLILGELIWFGMLMIMPLGGVAIMLGIAILFFAVISLACTDMSDGKHRD